LNNKVFGAKNPDANLRDNPRAFEKQELLAARGQCDDRDATIRGAFNAA
jgi:hypothetical protein